MVGRLKELIHRNNHFRMIGMISSLNMLLAVTAFLKDILLASYLGTSVEADAFLLAFFIIDMIGNNIIGFSVGISALPVFTTVSAKGNSKSLSTVLISVNLLMIAVMLVIAMILYANENVLISYLSFGFSSQTSLIFIRAFRIILVSLLIYPLISIANAVLQVSDRLVPGVLSSVLFNVIFLFTVLILSIFHVPTEAGISYISGAIVLATLLMLGLLYYHILTNRMIHIPQWSAFKNNIQESLFYLRLLLKLLIPCLFIIFLSQAMLFIERYFASNFVEGAVSALNYAYRLSQVPVWIFVSAIGLVFFPVMARLSDEKSRDEAADILVKSLKLMSLVTIPMMVALFALRYPIITILFKRGAFDDTSVAYTCQIIAGYSLGILGQSIIVLCLRFYLALKQIRVPFVLLTVSFGLNILIDLNLIPILGLAGIGYGSAISNTICAGLFVGNILRDKHKRNKYTKEN